MATNYPDGLDSFVNPTNTDMLSSATVPHAAQHTNANDAIEAIQAALGADPAGSALELNISQISASTAEEIAEEDIDTQGGYAKWVKFEINGVFYAIPVFALA